MEALHKLENFVVGKHYIIPGRFSIHAKEDSKQILLSDTNRRKLVGILKKWKEEQLEGREKRRLAMQKAKRAAASRKAWETRRRKEAA